MNIRKFDPAADFTRLETYLRRQIREDGSSASWLPERLHDLLYRVDGQEAAEGGTRSRDYIFLAEEDSRILGCILPDGENVYFGLASGLGTALIRGAVLRCRELGVGKCYVDCFGWRKDFYTAAGFTVEDRIGFWYRRLG